MIFLTYYNLFFGKAVIISPNDNVAVAFQNINFLKLNLWEEWEIPMGSRLNSLIMF